MLRRTNPTNRYASSNKYSTGLPYRVTLLPRENLLTAGRYACFSTERDPGEIAAREKLIDVSGRRRVSGLRPAESVEHPQGWMRVRGNSLRRLVKQTRAQSRWETIYVPRRKIRGSTVNNCAQPCRVHGGVNANTRTLPSEPSRRFATGVARNERRPRKSASPSWSLSTRERKKRAKRRKVRERT